MDQEYTNPLIGPTSPFRSEKQIKENDALFSLYKATFIHNFSTSKRLIENDPILSSKERAYLLELWHDGQREERVSSN